MDANERVIGIGDDTVEAARQAARATSEADRAETNASAFAIENAYEGGFEIVDGDDNALCEITTEAIRHPQIDAHEEALESIPPTSEVEDYVSGYAIKDEDDNVLIDITPTDIRHPAIDALRNAAAPVARSANAFAILGDSRMASMYADGAKQYKTTWSFFNFANALLGQRMEVAGNYAVAGQRSDEYLSTANVDAALATNAGWFLIFGVVNDIAQLSYEPFTTTIKPTCERIIAAGGKVILCTEPGATNFNGANGAAQRAAVERYNQQLRQFARNNPGVLLFDLAAVTVSPTSTGPVAFPSGYSGDGVHYYTAACHAQGVAFADLMRPLVPAQSQLIASAMESFANGGVNYLPNPLFLTASGGTAGGGVTGTVPSGFTAQCDTGITATASVAASTVGNEVVLQINATQAGQVRLFADMSSDLPGDVFAGMAEIAIDAGHSNLATAWLRLESQRAGVATPAFDLYSDTSHGVLPAGAHTFTARTEELEIATGTRGYFNWNVRAQFVGAGSATIRIRRASARKQVSI
ncbi:hypothetical protein A3711_09045 [Erythrobacter sp. HI00D59]|nr:hypothetical protein A3711_09045 [Erythrobacter sp. HI00D59]